MKKVLFILSVFIIFSVVQSCFPTLYYDIVDIEFRPTNGRKVKDELLFTIDYKFEYQRKAQVDLRSFTQKCYALTLHEAMDNLLLWDTFSLSFDKPFMYKDKQVPAGINVLLLNDIRKEVMIYEKVKDEGYTTIYDYSTQIEFSKTFMSQSDFQGEYRVEFSCETSDSRFFNKSTSVVFD